MEKSEEETDRTIRKMPILRRVGSKIAPQKAFTQFSDNQTSRRYKDRPLTISDSTQSPGRIGSKKIQDDLHGI